MTKIVCSSICRTMRFMKYHRVTVTVFSPLRQQQLAPLPICQEILLRLESLWQKLPLAPKENLGTSHGRDEYFCQDTRRTILVGGLVAIFYFPIYWECHHPNWLSYFSEGWPNHQPEYDSNPKKDRKKDIVLVIDWSFWGLLDLPQIDDVYSFPWPVKSCFPTRPTLG